MAPYIQDVNVKIKSGLNSENRCRVTLLTYCYYMMLDFVLGIVKGVNERDDTAIAENYIFAIKMLDLIWRQEMNLHPKVSRTDQEHDVVTKLNEVTSCYFRLWGCRSKYHMKSVGSEERFYSRISSLCGEEKARMIKKAVKYDSRLSDDSEIIKRFFTALVENVGEMADWLQEFYPALIAVFSTHSIDISYYGPLISAALPLALVSDRIIRMLKLECGCLEGLKEHYEPSKKLNEILKNANHESNNFVYIGSAYAKAGNSCEKLVSNCTVGFSDRVFRHMRLLEKKQVNMGGGRLNHIPDE